MERDPGIDRLFDRAAREIDPPVAVLVAESHRIGRRRRLHRRLRITGAALTVAALAATGAVTQWPAHSNGPTLTVAADPTATQSPTPTPPPTPTPSRTTEQLVPVTTDAMFGIFADQLPAGAKFVKYDDQLWLTGGKPDKYVHFDVDYDDGLGASTIGVSLQSSTVGLPAFGCAEFSGEGESTRPAGALPVSCSTRELPDGSRVESIVTGTGVSGLYDFNVHVRRPDGVVVRITAATGTVSGSGSGIAGTEVTRLVPPIGAAALESIVTDPRWQFQIPKSIAENGKALADRTDRLVR